MQFKSSWIARAAVTALIFGASAQATILNEFSNVVSWGGVATGTTTQTFNGATSYITSAAGITMGSVNYRGFYNESTSLGYDTYRYTPTPGSIEDIGSGSVIIGGSNVIEGNGAGVFDNGIRVDLSSLSNITALSFNFSGWRYNRNDVGILSTSVNPIVLRLEVFETGFGTQTRTLTVPATSGTVNLAGFFGFTTQGSITGVRLLIDAPNFVGFDTNDALSNRVVLDNFEYGQIAAQTGGGGETGGGAVPEPQTYLLCGAALLGAVALRRKAL